MADKPQQRGTKLPPNKTYAEVMDSMTYNAAQKRAFKEYQEYQSELRAYNAAQNIDAQQGNTASTDETSSNNAKSQESQNEQQVKDAALLDAVLAGDAKGIISALKNGADKNVVMTYKLEQRGRKLPLNKTYDEVMDSMMYNRAQKQEFQDYQDYKAELKTLPIWKDFVAQQSQLLNSNKNNQSPGNNLNGDEKSQENQPDQKAKDADLYKAVLAGDKNGIIAALKNGANIEAKDENDNTMFNLAIRKGIGPSITTLMEQGADINVPGADKDTPISHAIRTGKNGTLSLLYSKYYKADLEIKDKDGLTPIELAQQLNNEKTLAFLQDNNLLGVVEQSQSREQSTDNPQNVDAVAIEGNKVAETPTVNEGQPAENTVETDAKTQPQPQPATTPNPLIQAILDKKSREELDEIIKQHGAEALTALNDKGQNALMVAIIEKNKGACLALVDSGIDLNIQDKQGRTALMFAAQSDEMFFVQTLKQKGADILIKDNKGSIASGYIADKAKNKDAMEKALTPPVDESLSNIEQGVNSFKESIIGQASQSVLKVLAKFKKVSASPDDQRYENGHLGR